MEIISLFFKQKYYNTKMKNKKNLNGKEFYLGNRTPQESCLNPLLFNMHIYMTINLNRKIIAFSLTLNR